MHPREQRCTAALNAAMSRTPARHPGMRLPSPQGPSGHARSSGSGDDGAPHTTIENSKTIFEVEYLLGYRLCSRRRFIFFLVCFGLISHYEYSSKWLPTCIQIEHSLSFSLTNQVFSCVIFHLRQPHKAVYYINLSITPRYTHCNSHI